MAEIQNIRRAEGRLAHLRLEARRYGDAAKQRLAEDGLAVTARAALSLATAHAVYPLTVRKRRESRFSFRGTQLPYETSKWNNAWLNERAIEIAIARHILVSGGDGMLEVGNVLAHYGWGRHDVLDLFEGIPGVINDDVRTWQTPKRYSTITSISTLEHVGWDDPVKDPSGAVRSVKNLRSLLEPGGTLLVTVPLGYNSYLDDALQSGALKFDETVYLERTTKQNDWVETTAEAAFDRRYGERFRNANAVLVGIDHAPR